MPAFLNPSEARRRILVEWRLWADRTAQNTGARNRADAMAFFNFLETDKSGLLRSLGPEVDAATVHGWLFRNGEVVD